MDYNEPYQQWCQWLRQALLFLFISLVLLDHAKAESQLTEHAALARIFQEGGVTGTFVLLDLRSDAMTVHNAKRAAERFIPASTFKIPNSLIGLETGAVKNVDETLPYGGKPQLFPDWEHDMPLREAIRVSAVPIYQELARRIGLERMQPWVERLGYGNAQIGNVVDRFWLDGPLKISAIEQARFLARLVKGELPLKAEAIAAVKEITVLEKGEGYVLHGKTGWCTSTDPDVGWWVGWVDRPGSGAAFALNMNLPDKADLAKRVSVGKACLTELGVLPTSELK